MRTRLPFVTFALAACCVAIHFVPDMVDVLQYERGALVAGEWWRALTGHFTHFDANHLAWDVIVLLVLGGWCEWQSRKRMLGTLALAGIAIPTALACWQPQFSIYRGLSGLDCALFGLASGSLLRNRARVANLIGVAAITAFAAKSTLELTTGSTVFASGQGYAPVPLAHLVGVFAGAVAALARNRDSLCAAENFVEQLRGLFRHPIRDPAFLERERHQPLVELARVGPRQ